MINSEQMGRSAVLVDRMPWLLWDDPPLISRRRLAADSLFQPQQTSNNRAVDFRGLQVYQASVRNGPRLTLVITLPMSSLRVALLICKMESSKSNFLPVPGSILESLTAKTSGNKSLKWSTMGRRWSSTRPHLIYVQVDSSTSTHYSLWCNDILCVVGSAWHFGCFLEIVAFLFEGLCAGNILDHKEQEDATKLVFSRLQSRLTCTFHSRNHALSLRALLLFFIQ